MSILKSVFLLLSLISLLYAQTPEETAQKTYLANINTLLIFTSESGLSSGNYKFTKAGFKMKSYSLPFRYSLAPIDKNLRLFINGTTGYSITRLDTKTTTRSKTTGQDIVLTHDNKLQTYTGGVGLGLDYESDLGIDFLGSIGVIYSRVGTSIQPKDEIGEAIKDFFDDEYNDNITYRFYLAAEYEHNIEEFRSYAKIDFKSYETKADFTLDALSGFTTQSKVTGLSFGIESPSLLKYEEDFLSLEGYVKLNYLNGDITDVVQFDKYMNIGSIAYWNTPKSPSWAKRFYMEVSTVRAEGLEGYNVGIGFSIDY